MGPIGIFGGTFDPIHFGHLRTAFELLDKLALSEIRFIPCGVQPLRERPATAGDLRLAMVEAAVAEERRFSVDPRELAREGPSYSVDTLEAVRSENPTHPLCLILGMDSFLSLPHWHRWQELMAFAHLVVAHRPGWRVPESGTLGELVRDCGTDRVEDLHEADSGRLYVTACTQLEISASQLRNSIRAGLDPRYLLPESVREIIVAAKCYLGEAREDSDV